MSNTEKTIIIMLIGIMFSAFILFAGSRSVFIDQMAINWGVEVWEIGFTVYFVSLIIAIGYSMLTDRGKFGKRDYGDIVVISMFAVISYFALSVMAVGGISVAVTAMQNENVEWSLMYALLIAVYMAGKMVKR